MVIELEREQVQTNTDAHSQPADAVYRLVLELVRSWPEERQAALVAEVQGAETAAAAREQKRKVNAALALLKEARVQPVEEEVIRRLNEAAVLLRELPLSTRIRERLRTAIARSDRCLRSYTIPLSDALHNVYRLVADDDQPYLDHARRRSVHAIGSIETREPLTDERIAELKHERRMRHAHGG